jgi:abscisic-aldehyde oxidase
MLQPFDMQAKMVGVDLSAKELYVPGASGSYLNYGAAASEVPLKLHPCFQNIR